MKCYYHQNEEAVAQCSYCGIYLCKECSNLYDRPVCSSCAHNMVNESKKSLIIAGIIGVVIAVILGFYSLPEILSSNSFIHIVQVVIYIFALCTIPFGWKLLNKITPDIFLSLPIIGWLIYILIKGFISIFIGFIALPYLIIKHIQLEKTVRIVEKERKE